MITCKGCGLPKPEAEFYKSKNTKSGYRGSCKLCINAQNTQWYSANKESLAPVRKAYADAHTKDSARRMREFRDRNPEVAHEQYSKNKNRILARSRANYKAKPGYSGWKSSRRRSRIRSNGGSFSYQELMSLYALHDNKCINPECLQVDSRLTPDHVIPLAKGGANNIDNIQPLCMTCNLRKGIKIIDYRPSKADGQG